MAQSKTSTPLKAAGTVASGWGRELFVLVAMVLVAVTIGFGVYRQLGLGFSGAAVSAILAYVAMFGVHAFIGRAEALRSLTLENERLRREIAELRAAPQFGEALRRAEATVESEGSARAYEAPSADETADRLTGNSARLGDRGASKPHGSRAPVSPEADHGEGTIAPWLSPLTEAEADAAALPPLQPAVATTQAAAESDEAAVDIVHGRIPVPAADLRHFPERHAEARTSPPVLAGEIAMEPDVPVAEPSHTESSDEMVARSIEALRHTARAMKTGAPSEAAGRSRNAHPPVTAAPSAMPLAMPLKSRAASPQPPEVAPRPHAAPAPTGSDRMPDSSGQRVTLPVEFAQDMQERHLQPRAVVAHEEIQVRQHSIAPAMMPPEPQRLMSEGPTPEAVVHQHGQDRQIASHGEIEAALHADRLRITLQSIAELGTRRTDRIEVSAELPIDNDRILDAEELARAAAGSGLLPLVDVTKLIAIEQVLARLSARTSPPGLISGFSGESLLDTTFLDGFAEVAEGQTQMAATLVPAFALAEVRHFSDAQWETLQTMVEHGFRFMMSAVTDLDIDFTELKARGFDFVRLDADVLISGMPTSEGQIVPAADICHHLAEVGLAVVVGRIDDERKLAEIMGFGAVLGQGTLFGAPKPMRLDRPAGGARDGASHAAVA